MERSNLIVRTLAELPPQLQHDTLLAAGLVEALNDPRLTDDQRTKTLADVRHDLDQSFARGLAAHVAADLDALLAEARAALTAGGA